MSRCTGRALASVLTGLLALSVVGCSGSPSAPGPEANARSVVCQDFLNASEEVRGAIVKNNLQSAIHDAPAEFWFGRVDAVCMEQPGITVADAMSLADAQTTQTASSIPATTASSAPVAPAGDGTPMCSDFLKMSSDRRDQLVSQVAVDRNETRVLNPAWRSNVEMVCGEHLGWTVGAVIDSVAGKPEPTAQTTIDSETGDEVPADLPTCNPNDPWFKKLQDVGEGKCKLSG